MSSSSSSSSLSRSSRSSSLTSHLHKRFSTLLLLNDEDGVDSNDATTEASSLLQDLTEDAYFHFSGYGPARGQLPQFEWSACRKAYTILFWMRPILSDQVLEEGKGDDPARISTVVERYLYRFFTNNNNVGVVVRCSQWVAKIEDNEVQTTLTACTYDASMQAGAPVTLPLSLRLNQWSLVGCSHVFPYLKRPQWTLCVNGSVVGSGDLAYPQTSSLMESNTILQNVVLGGALCPPPTPDATNASTNASTGTTRVLQMDVASCTIYPSAVSPALQAVLTEADVTFATQSSLAPWLPPIANWTKGSSIEAGPKVGIPLAVHPTAPQLQQLAGTLLMGLSASQAHVLGGGEPVSQQMLRVPQQQPQQKLQLQQRLVCPMSVSAGATTVDSPRVGLVQPTPPPPIRYHTRSAPNHPLSEEAPVLYLTGHVQLVQSPLLIKWQQHLARNQKSNANPDGGWEAFQEEEDATASSATSDQHYRHATLLWEPLPGYVILPFFLSLCPPAVLLESKPHQEYMYDKSIQILHQLYTTPLAGQLVQLLTKFIQKGGTRAVEIVLQDGILHSLASNLRLSLLRAQRGRLLHSNAGSSGTAELNATTTTTLAELKRRLQRLDDITSCSTTIIATTTNLSSSSHHNSKTAGAIVVSPRFIPPTLVQACCDLVAVCCGPPANRMSDPSLYPSDCVKRTSDLALTAIFGLALDLDLWSGHAASLAKMLEVVADRYGGFCVTLGYILRSQVSIQYFLDTVRLAQQQQSSTNNNNDASSSDLAQVGRHQTRLVTAMLMASLSNKRSISQGEHDVASCMNALSDCPLGTLGAHVILNAIVGILVWCDVLPVEAAEPLAMADLSSSSSGHYPQSSDEEHKMQVASRLGRNLLISQFHDVVAPMVLSRTVFSAESTTLLSSTSSSTSTSSSSLDAKKSPLSWENHWRLALLLFSWVASIAGPEGLMAAKSCGSLLLASGLAGSLEGALDDAEKQIVSALYLPPPGMALMIGSMILHDWSYTDLLADRLGIMMPLLPGLVVGLLSHPSYATAETRISRRSLTVLADLLTAMGGAFHRVFGGTIHLHYQTLTEGGAAPPKSQVKTSRDKSADSVKAAKSHVPHLLVVAFFLEKHIILRQRRREQLLQQKQQTRGATKPLVTIVSRPEVSRERLKHIDLESWVEISSSESVISDVVVTVPPAPDKQDVSDVDEENGIVLPVLHDCEKSVLNTAAGLISNAMSLGGAGAAISIWNHVLSALEVTVAHTKETTDRSTRTTTRTKASQDTSTPSSLPRQEESLETATTTTTTTSETGDSPTVTATKSLDHPDDFLARDVLCRLISIVLTKALKRHDQWEVWSYEMSSAVARVCLLVEEKQLLGTAINRGQVDDSGGSIMSDDQILLLSTMLEVMSYGRDTTGWCQLSLPAMSNSFAEGGRAHVDLSAASKLLLPVLEPCFRVVIICVRNIPSHLDIEIVTMHHPGAPHSQPTVEVESSKPTKSESRRASLLSLAITELDLTLTAAIVGRSFAAARDMALNAMATLRAAAEWHQEAGDIEATKICRGLIHKVAEELRVRYEGERRLRETALFDAYEDDLKDGAVQAVEGANAIERLILGGDMLGPESQNLSSSQEMSVDERRKGLVSDDFVLFHELEGAAQNERGQKKLGYAHYEGLGAALEECKILETTAESHDELVAKILGVLGPYLDAWDVLTRSDAELTELVELFGSALETQMIDGNRTMGNSMDTQKFAIIGSEGAADAMSAFFEFAAAEKSRLKEISLRFLPSQRHSRMSFAERFCWARFMEFSPVFSEMMWERGLPDGNRDMRSRIPTVPCTPQFRRFIPKYLDHYSEEVETEETESENVSSSSLRRHSSISITGEIDAFTKSLLQSGNLEIFDITKQEVTEDEEPDLPLRAALGSVDEDDLGVFNDNVPDVDPSADTDKKKPPSVDTVLEEAAEDDGLPEEMPNPDSGPLLNEIVVKGQHSITTSAFSTPPDNASSSLSLMHSAAAGMIEQHMDNCLHVKAEGSRHCTMLLTSTHLVLEYEGDPEGFFEGEVLAAQEDADRQRMIKEAGEYKESTEDVYQQKVDRRQRDIASLRPKSQRWNLSEVSHVYLRRYRLRDSSIEIFFIPSGGTSFGGYGLFSPSSSLFLDFGPGHEGCRRRDDAAFAIMYRVPPQAMKQWPDRSVQFLHDQLSRLTVGWVEGRITNFDYLLHLNMLAGRSYNDLCQYPVFPWVLADYTSSEIPDLTDRKNFRDLTKPVGALNPDRLEEFLERFKTFSDPSIPPFMYGSHYSTSAGVVLHFLVRLHPFAGLHRQLQSGHFDVADRLFSSVPRTWSMCTGTSAAEVKELIPEFYCNPSFLKNTNNFKLGTSQDGDVLGDVVLPPWAKGSPEKFVEVMRGALESEICSQMLPDWIDLIFGRSQQGPEAIKANNVFFYLTYYGSVDVASISDEGLRHATELQIAHFGQCPMQLLRRPHVRRIPRAYHRLSFYQLLSPYSQRLKPTAVETDDSTQPWISKAPQRGSIHGEPYLLPFFSAPLSHWVHLDAPPPGPHAALIAVRFAGADRCLAVDSQGIFHTFRWAWRSEEEQAFDRQLERRDFDLGCFVAQRELPRFRSVPRLMLDLLPGQKPAVAISKTLFAGRSVLLVLSDGDGCGGLGMQLVDPSKGQIRGEVMIPAVHAGRITCIATDPIGTAAGHGGVGGELALFGSLDGTASLWRFMSSHYLPLRPRVRLRGQQGCKVSAVALCSGTFIAATLSADRCCLYSIGNGNMIRSFGPPQNTLGFTSAEDTILTTKFADTPALGVSVQGFVVTVCETLIQSKSAPERKVVMLHLFTIEGVSLGSKPLESWRGLPHKMHCTPDGTAVLVCCGRGITIHRISACAPLDILDEWQITEADSLGTSVPMDAAFDIDLGPSLSRPVVAAAACSKGVLRLHALPGISAWSERNKKSGISQTVGTALAKPAQRLNRAMREGIGLGRQLAGVGRDIGKEVTSDVKERGVTAFFGNLMRPKGN